MKAIASLSTWICESWWVDFFTYIIYCLAYMKQRSATLIGKEILSRLGTIAGEHVWIVSRILSDPDNPTTIAACFVCWKMSIQLNFHSSLLCDRHDYCDWQPMKSRTGNGHVSCSDRFLFRCFRFFWCPLSVEPCRVQTYCHVCVWVLLIRFVAKLRPSWR